MPKSYRILSLDGGGIRGLLTAVWLERLERKLKVTPEKPLREHFDLIAGTSTGSILACAVSLGIPCKTIIDLYVEKGRTVFPAAASRLWSRFRRTFSDGLSAPKYDGQGLEEVLRDVFGTATLGELAVKPTVVTAYDVFTRSPVVFKNTRERYAELPVWQVCKASCSAPTFFPATLMEINEAECPLVDGGVVANNPTACAIAEGVLVNKKLSAKQRVPLEKFVVASFGTGHATRSISPQEAQEWGALEWLVPIIDVLFDGSSDAVDYIASQLIEESRYFRFQTKLDDAYDDMDNADTTNLKALLAIANRFLNDEEGDKQLERLVKCI